jgi:hypothetical protein
VVGVPVVMEVLTTLLPVLLIQAVVVVALQVTLAHVQVLMEVRE